MKADRRASRSQRLISLVHLSRIRLSVAENTLESAEELARLARQRRKEAKQAARRAKKQLRRARAEVAEARQALVDAEAGLARASNRVAISKRKSPKSTHTGSRLPNRRPRRKPGSNSKPPWH